MEFLGCGRCHRNRHLHRHRRGHCRGHRLDYRRGHRQSVIILPSIHPGVLLSTQTPYHIFSDNSNSHIFSYTLSTLSALSTILQSPLLLLK